MECQSLFVAPDVELSFIGPDLDEGPMPAFFYFALSGEESLCLDPYNQPVAFLKDRRLRIFSLDIPYHGKGLSPLKALEGWAKELSHGKDIIDSFTEKVSFAIEDLLRRGILIKGKIGAAGLSRGAFIASHVAAKTKEVGPILGFAPLTHLSFAKEFEEIKDAPLVKAMNLEVLIDALVGRPLRFYIGNRDKRVGTSLCFHFIEKLAEASYLNKHRSPNVELHIGPSIGHLGHGTSQEVFEAGAAWMAQKLETGHG